MMNLAQAYTYASLVCMGTDLDVGMVSAMHMLGLLVVQAAFCVSSGVPNFAIASSDITVAILNHKIVREVYSVASRVPLHARHDTAICALCLCTVVQGVLYLALGRMKAAEMVQYLPHPVTAGVLASTGCAIVRSALAVTTGIDVSAPSTEHSLLTLIMAWPQQVIAASTLALLVVQVSARFNPATAFLLLVRATCRYLCTLVRERVWVWVRVRFAVATTRHCRALQPPAVACLTRRGNPALTPTPSPNLTPTYR